mmetsp:Transcript_10067/g.19833  ORF Transcript_10067/g.19833 Transcript_10067/m.19833 type:complete len:102 (+) Transcript_10067:1755-2060(+)
MAHLNTDPLFVICNHCGKEGETLTKSTPGRLSCLCCCLLCLMGCYLCCYIPCCMKVFRDTIHRCRHCNFMIQEVRTMNQVQEAIMRDLDKSEVPLAGKSDE